MNNNKKRTRNGFTLIELIIVMAIFSLLLLAVIAIAKPAEAMNKHASDGEKTYAVQNNIEKLVHSKIQYADCLKVVTSDKLASKYDVTPLVQDYKDNHYNGVVSTDDGTAFRFIKGTIYVMRLYNSDKLSGGSIVQDSAGNSLQKGQITVQPFTFNADPAISVSAGEEKCVLNPAYFKIRDLTYDYHYTLGAGNLKVVDPGLADENTYKALNEDENDFALGMDYNNLSLSIVTSGRGAFTDTASYRAFANPCDISICNLPLTNVIGAKLGGNSKRARLRVDTPKDTSVTPATPATWKDQEDITTIYEQDINNLIDFNDDIIFIYSYADEFICDNTCTVSPDSP